MLCQELHSRLQLYDQGLEVALLRHQHLAAHLS